MTNPRRVMMPRQYVTAPPLLGLSGSPLRWSILPRPAGGTPFAYNLSRQRHGALPLPPLSRRGDVMLIRLGYEMAFRAPVATPMLLLLYVHPSRATTLRRPDRVRTDPEVAVEEFLDGHGNRCGR